jgi:putative spermidine/putrescine transport system ATP-binding protein
MDRRPHAAEIRAVGIGKNYGPFEALKGIDLAIGSGEFVTLLGPSGSGKTTFLMILAGFEPASTGTLLRNGVDITDDAPEERNFGMVFQGYALFPHMSVADNIAFPLRVRRKPAAEIRQRVGEMIERVGLEGHAHKRPAQLSGGQQQRVALARALSFEPDVLLLDEPFSALDKNLREAMQAEVRRLHRDLGTTFVFVTHDQGEALALSSRIAIFERGRLLQFGTPREVYDRPVDRFTAEFLGEINLLPLSDLKCDGGLAVGRLDGVAIAAPAPDAALAGHAFLGVRPENVRLLTPGSELPAGTNAVPVRLGERTYLGARTRLDLTTASGVRLTAEVPTVDPVVALEAGAPLVFAFSPADGRIVPDASSLA